MLLELGSNLSAVSFRHQNGLANTLRTIAVRLDPFGDIIKIPAFLRLTGRAIVPSRSVFIEISKR